MGRILLENLFPFVQVLVYKRGSNSSFTNYLDSLKKKFTEDTGNDEKSDEFTAKAKERVTDLLKDYKNFQFFMG